MVSQFTHLSSNLTPRFNLDPENEDDEPVPRKAQQIMNLSKIGLRGMNLCDIVILQRKNIFCTDSNILLIYILLKKIWFSDYSQIALASL